jgi:hypothetical protein
MQKIVSPDFSSMLNTDLNGKFKKITCALIVFIFIALTGCSEESVSKSPEMPPFSNSLQKMQDFYRIKFLPDGYPGRDDGWAHPIYGVYVLNDYLRQYSASPSEELKEALTTVAYAVVNRMEEHRGALVFWYEAAPERGARLYRKHYSGLTQGYYAESLYRVGELLGDPELIDAAGRVFDSLTISVEEGGVLHNTIHGPVIAEVPQEPNSWILNGWQSALISVHRYAELSKSKKAHDLFKKSTKAMAGMLHLYDVEDLANSRYGLTGFTYLRINPSGSGVALRNAAIVVPGEQSVAIDTNEGTRWQSYFFDADTTSIEHGVKIVGSSARLNAVLSIASSPKPNRLEFDFDAGRPMEITIDILLGSYDPLSSAPVNNKWVELTKLTAVPGARVSVDIPVEVIKQIAYPTNFRKKISGEQVNVYHPIHVLRLRQLANVSGIEELKIWSDRWESYICNWAYISRYDGYKVREYHSIEKELVDPKEVCNRIGQ